MPLAPSSTAVPQATMGRTLLFVLDSLGIGGAPDAHAYDNNGTPDTGANTLLHIAQHCANGQCDGRAEYGMAPTYGPLKLPNLAKLGLGHAAALADQNNLYSIPPGLEQPAPSGQFAALVETSNGKDTPSGHYELCGVPVTFDWGYFPKTVPCLPPALVQALVTQCDLPGVLGQKHASGTQIIAELGQEHMRSGKPIVYTSADSVLQIAAHEDSFGLERLYRVCEAARVLCDPLNIGRVIARPFVGTNAQNFKRTGNRKDIAVPPPGYNLLDVLTDNGHGIWTIGKIGDIFAHRSTGTEIKASGLPNLVQATLDTMSRAAPGDLIFTNFVDFDSQYGHRRDVAGYASALEYWDTRLPDMVAAMRPGDRMIITADHGNDPTWIGTDHTREQVPMLLLESTPDFQPGQSWATGFGDVAHIIATAYGLDGINAS